MGVIVSTEKTKGMVMGEELSEEYVAPAQVEGGEIEMVEQFTYLGSVLSCKWGGHEGCEKQDCQGFEGLWLSEGAYLHQPQSLNTKQCTWLWWCQC